MSAKTLPFKISIAAPCPARWEDMAGSDRMRFCSLCQKNVHNLSAMTDAEAAALLEEQGGSLCARIYQRADGTILTENCPVGLQRYWRRLKGVCCSGLAAVLFLTVLARTAVAGGNSNGSDANFVGRVSSLVDDAVWKVKGWFGINRPVVLMGVIAVPVPQTNSTSSVNPPAPPATVPSHSDKK